MSSIKDSRAFELEPERTLTKPKKGLKRTKTKQKTSKHFRPQTPCVGKCWLIQKAKTGNHRKRRQIESEHRNDNILC